MNPWMFLYVVTVMKYLRIYLTGYTYNIFFCFTNIIFAWMFFFVNATPKLIVTEETYAHTFHISNNFWLPTKVVKNNFLSSIRLLPWRVGYFTQFEIFSHVGGSKQSHINLKFEIVNLKYKTDCFMWRKRELHWCHFAFQCSAQWSVEGISYNSLRSFIQRHAIGTSSYNEWINLEILNTSAAIVCNRFRCNEK